MRRLKTALVTSFVGAIALGWLFAQALLHFAGIFATPIATSILGREYRDLTGRSTTSMGYFIQGAVPELVKCVVLLLVGYVLLRWLYFTPVGQNPAESKVEQPSL